MRDFPRRPVGVRAFVQVGVEHGLAPDQCLAGTGITEQTLQLTDFVVDARQELAVARNLLATLGDRPGLGAEAGSHFTLGSIGILGFAMVSSGSGREAIGLGMQHVALSSMFTTAHLETDSTTVRLILDADEMPDDVRGLMVERDLAAIASVVPLAVGGDRRSDPIWVELDSDADRRAATSRHLSAVPVEPGDRPALALPVGVLDLPLPTADPDTARLCRARCANLIEKHLQNSSTAALVRKFLSPKTGSIPSMPDVAKAMHLDVRTLHRRLEREGTSFRELFEQDATSWAVTMLNQDLTVEEVGRRLGYSDPAAFSRAFKRWTGKSPSRLRGTGS